LALGLPTAAVVMRIARAAMLEVLPSDYLRTARAKGLSPRVVSFKHALRNALIPVVSVVGLNMGLILGNTIVLEIVFSRPGIGRLLIGSIFNRDFAVLQSTLIVYAVCIALINLLTDLAYGVVNPAIRYE
jgi:ABC-type dipeptide/oligopeptide/nickel transport system permease component